MTIKLTINLRDSSMPRKNEVGTALKPVATIKTEHISPETEVFVVYLNGIKYHTFWHECAAQACANAVNNGE